MKLNKLFNFQALVIAFEFAFVVCFFTSIFWNQNVINLNGAYYINRGVPIAWSGIMTPKVKIHFPVVVAPLIKIKDGEHYVKIINLNVFGPEFVGILLIGYLGLAKVVKKGKSTKLIQASLLLMSIYLYFFWFPRI